MNNHRHWLVLLLAAVIASTLGCALTQPRDLQVWSKDRSGRARQQHCEFYISWSHLDVDQVRFEYRQTGMPDQTLKQTQNPEHKSWIVFEIPQKDIQAHGSVCAWRVTLLTSTGVCLAERKSATWQ